MTRISPILISGQGFNIHPGSRIALVDTLRNKIKNNWFQQQWIWLLIRSLLMIEWIGIIFAWFWLSSGLICVGLIGWCCGLTLFKYFISVNVDEVGPVAIIPRLYGGVFVRPRLWSLVALGGNWVMATTSQFTMILSLMMMMIIFMSHRVHFLVWSRCVWRTFFNWLVLLGIIDGLMVPSDISRILQIPVSLFHTRDRLIWHYEKHGIYTVKSAYRLGFNMFEIESTRYVVDGPWLKLWNSTLPPELKILFGTVFVALPSRCRLAERGCMVLTSCVRCGGQEDVAIFLWSMWYFRNLVLWKNAVTDGSQILAFATQFWSDWHASHVAHGQVQLPPYLQQDAVGSWSPPPARAFKCNVDSASFSAQQRTEFANVLRDAQGSFVKAFSGSCPALLYPRLYHGSKRRTICKWFLKAIVWRYFRFFERLCQTFQNLEFF